MIRAIELVVDSHCGPGVNQLRNGTAYTMRAPSFGSTGKLYLYQQAVVIQRHRERWRAEGLAGKRENRAEFISLRFVHF